MGRFGASLLGKLHERGVLYEPQGSWGLARCYWPIRPYEPYEPCS